MLTIPLCGGTVTWMALSAPEAQVAFRFSCSYQLEFEDDFAEGPGPNAQASGTLTVSPVVQRRPFVGAVREQIIRLVAGPVFVPPGVPVEINLGFVDTDGKEIGPNSTATLLSGETAILDLNVDTLVQRPGQRVEVRPVVVVANVADGSGRVSLAPPPVSIQQVTQVFDRLTGFETLLVPGRSVLSANTGFEFQGLAGGQTIRFIVSSYPPYPCVAILGFANRSGRSVGPSRQVNLEPGQTATLDLDAETLGLEWGQRIEAQPTISADPSTKFGAAAISVCEGSAEVFDHFTGRTWTYQYGGSELPAVK